MPYLYVPPPPEWLIIEIAFFLIIATMCLIIFQKTKDVYALTNHQGIFFFRSMFLNFALAYLFRLEHVILLFSREIFTVDFPRYIHGISLFFVSYFSTVAILSLAATVVIHKLRIKRQDLLLLLHIVAISTSLIAFLTRSHPILIVLQTIIILFTMLYSVLVCSKQHKKKTLSHTKITYVLLFTFWILSTLTFTKHMLPIEIKLILYILSIAVFGSIIVRVFQRLRVNGKKTRSS